MGIVFGFALEKSRVFEPGVIVGQMQLRNFIMLKVFLTAVATGAVVLAVLNGFGFVKLRAEGGALCGRHRRRPDPRRRHRAGRRLSGHRRWRRSAPAIATRSSRWSAVSSARSPIPMRSPALSKTVLGASSGKLIFSDLIGIPYWIGAIVLALCCVAILALLERRFPTSREYGSDVDGNLEAGENRRHPRKSRCFRHGEREARGSPGFARPLHLRWKVPRPSLPRDIRSSVRRTCALRGVLKVASEIEPSGAFSLDGLKMKALPSQCRSGYSSRRRTELQHQIVAAPDHLRRAVIIVRIRSGIGGKVRGRLRASPGPACRQGCRPVR